MSVAAAASATEANLQLILEQQAQAQATAQQAASTDASISTESQNNLPSSEIAGTNPSDESSKRGGAHLAEMLQQAMVMVANLQDTVGASADSGKAGSEGSAAK